MYCLWYCFDLLSSLASLQLFIPRQHFFLNFDRRKLKFKRKREREREREIERENERLTLKVFLLR
jgi:hypothetical protein